MKTSSSLCLCDAHAHFSSPLDLAERQNAHIPTLFNAGTPEEAQQLRSVCSHEGFLLSCGLHPWYADQYSFHEILPFLKQVSVIGEIGMDTIWCEVPLSIQESCFQSQLAFACDEKKPVILHTKGQERRIASIIKEYKNQYLVHWYSSSEPPDAYLALDCYFSIGPDVFWNPFVQQTALLIPENRLLIETDGLSAVQWACKEAPASFQHHIEGQNLPTLPLTASNALLSTLQTVSSLRSVSCDELSRSILENWMRFSGK